LREWRERERESTFEVSEIVDPSGEKGDIMYFPVDESG